MRKAMAGDTALSQGLRKLLEDDELWVLYKPTGHEINMLRNTFGPLGRGGKSAYREALRLLWELALSF